MQCILTEDGERNTETRTRIFIKNDAFQKLRKACQFQLMEAINITIKT